MYINLKIIFLFRIVFYFLFIILYLSENFNLYANDDKVLIVSRQEIIKAMKMQTGYDITATTNGGRFNGELILQLARWAQERDPDEYPLLINYQDNFCAYLEVTGLTIKNVPAFVLKPYQHRQNQLIEYRKNHIIKIRLHVFQLFIH